jgi:hypothetical protein
MTMITQSMFYGSLHQDYLDTRHGTEHVGVHMPELLDYAFHLWAGRRHQEV